MERRLRALLIVTFSFVPVAVGQLVGPCGSALDLTEPTQFAEVPSSADLQNPTALTIELWFRADDQDNGRLVTKGDGVRAITSRSYDLTYLDDGRIRWDTFTGPAGTDGYATAVTLAQVAPRTWTHVAAVFDSGSGLMSIYLNGVLDVSITQTAIGLSLAGRTIRQSGQPVRFGKTPPFDSSAFSGQLDEIRIWSVARTPSEIAGNINASITTAPGLAASWLLDGNLLDDAGAHDGSLVGGASFVASPAPDGGTSAWPRHALCSTAMLPGGDVLSMQIWSTRANAFLAVLADSVLGPTPLGVGGVLGTSDLALSSALFVVTDPFSGGLQAPVTDGVGSWSLAVIVPTFLGGFSFYAEAFIVDPSAPNGLFETTGAVHVVVR